MRTGWEIKKLGEVSQISTGKWDSNHSTENGQFRFYTCASNYLMCDTKRFSGECIILPGNGANVGEVFYYEGIFDAYQRTYVISNITLFPKYLYYHLIAFWKERNLNKQFGSATNFLKIENFNNYEVKCPDLSEQQRIVSILDEAFSSIEQAKENLQRNLQNAKELFQSEMNSIFTNKGEGWEEKTLKEVSLEFGRGKSKHRPRGDESLLGGDFPLIQTGEISNSNHWITSFTRTYNEKGLAQSKLWEKGTICIAIVGANVAETGILTFDACFPDSVIGIVVNPKCANNQYVEYLLQTFKAYLKEKGKGTARDNINMGTFESQKFPFPNVETQQKIVQQLDKLSTETKRLEAMYQLKLDALEELKKSILQKAFSGELSN